MDEKWIEFVTLVRSYFSVSTLYGSYNLISSDVYCHIYIFIYILHVRRVFSTYKPNLYVGKTVVFWSLLYNFVAVLVVSGGRD